MINVSHINVHHYATGVIGGNQDMRLTKGTHLQDTSGRGCTWYASRLLVTTGTTADCSTAAQLIEGFDAQYLLAERGYDTNEITAMAQSFGIEAVIPPMKNRKEQRVHDRHLYKLRHLVEGAFLHLKRWRGMATRYAKNTSSFVATVQIRCIAFWCNLKAARSKIRDRQRGPKAHQAKK